MTYEPTAPQPAEHVEPPLPPERRRLNLAWVIPVGAVVALVLFMAGWLSGSAYTDKQRAEGTNTTSLLTPTGDPIAALDEGEIGIPDEEVPEATPPAGPTLSAADIKLTPKVSEKNCFGSAGCNVTVKIQMAYNGPTLAEDETFEVTYELTGAEDGPIIGTFEVTGPNYTEDEQSFGTKSSRTKITAKVTGVEKVG